MIQYGFNPDYAAPIDRKRETEPLRSKVDGFLPLTRYRSTVLGEDTKPHSNDVRECKMTLKLHSRTPSLLQDSASLPAVSVCFGIHVKSNQVWDLSPRTAENRTASKVNAFKTKIVVEKALKKVPGAARQLSGDSIWLPLKPAAERR